MINNNIVFPSFFFLALVVCMSGSLFILNASHKYHLYAPSWGMEVLFCLLSIHFPLQKLYSFLCHKCLMCMGPFLAIWIKMWATLTSNHMDNSLGERIVERCSVTCTEEAELICVQPRISAETPSKGSIFSSANAGLWACDVGMALCTSNTGIGLQAHPMFSSLQSDLWDSVWWHTHRFNV